MNLKKLINTLTISVQLAFGTDQTRIVASGEAVNATSCKEITIELDGDQEKTYQKILTHFSGMVHNTSDLLRMTFESCNNLQVK